MCKGVVSQKPDKTWQIVFFFLKKKKGSALALMETPPCRMEVPYLCRLGQVSIVSHKPVCNMSVSQGGDSQPDDGPRRRAAAGRDKRLARRDGGARWDANGHVKHLPATGGRGEKAMNETKE